ncbi:putative transcriptional regulator, Crp/Fnr family [Thermocrinis albus DSM 14484]|uniref:Putative transcriptional regulator, Crp/Fnr family n=1 Tax=Thermocrinis albus (strain DSM 14484 / JCM 11386 / HI 11/12) TaxID=638303 RepID=D3SPH4_THEAH|nr:Crp/Fnr family transcriptional regulator [Thermocrinis albus]ADC89061.1 putative transcriptional regulator, Crp/Fnr family [Thermocrinis albus DSM 14484]
MSVVERLKRYIEEGLVAEHTYKVGEDLSFEKGVYVVKEGVIELFTFKRKGKQVLDLLFKGDVIGFLLRNTSLTNYKARPLTPSTLFYIKEDALIKIGEKEPHLALDIFASLLSKQAYLYNVLTIVFAGDATEKIRDLMCLLERRAEEKGTYLTLRKSQIASITGLSYEHVVRKMKCIRIKNKNGRIRLW